MHLLVALTLLYQCMSAKRPQKSAARRRLFSADFPRRDAFPPFQELRETPGSTWGVVWTRVRVSSAGRGVATLRARPARCSLVQLAKVARFCPKKPPGPRGARRPCAPRRPGRKPQGEPRFWTPPDARRVARGSLCVSLWTAKLAGEVKLFFATAVTLNAVAISDAPFLPLPGARGRAGARRNARARLQAQGATRGKHASTCDTDVCNFFAFFRNVSQTFPVLRRKVQTIPFVFGEIARFRKTPRVCKPQRKF